MHAYNGVLTILGLACFLYLVFCVSVKVKLTVSLLCVCVHSAWKGHLQNDLYCVGRDVKPYSLTHFWTICMAMSSWHSHCKGLPSYLINLAWALIGCWSLEQASQLEPQICRNRLLSTSIHRYRSVLLRPKADTQENDACNKMEI